MEIFQPSLFGSKAEFDKDNFEFVIDKGDFCGHIANAIEKALSIVKEYRDENSVTSTLYTHSISAKSQSIEPLQDNADDEEFQKVQPKIKKGIRKEIL